IKFGFGRATDHACLHIRRGRLTRQDGLDAVRRLDGRFPWSYLGKSLEDILSPLGMTVDEFVRICDKFTNKKIFKRDVSGALLKDRDGNLTKLNYDNV
ncbi:MAG: N-acetyl sugar amidotransferase, partial [Oxalobacteraceae bacterium]